MAGRCIPIRDIVGNAEVRALCGNVTRHTLIRWRKELDFPKPIRKLTQGELWDRREVRGWYTARTAIPDHR